jgi:hypothetical protein
MTKPYIADVIADALELEGGGIQPKVKIALKLLVEHLDDAERAIERLRRRCDQLERIAHPPTTIAVSNTSQP